MRGFGSEVRITIFGIKSIPAFAGPDRVVERLLGQFLPTYRFSVYMIKTGSAKGGDRPGCLYHFIPTVEGKHIKAFVYFALCTLHYLVKGKSDVIHVQDSSFGLFVPFLRLKPGVKILGTLHGNPYDRQKWGRFAKWYLRLSERFFVNWCDYITSVAEPKVRELHSTGVTNVEFIPNGIDPWDGSTPGSEFDPEKFGLDEGRYILFACGRLDATKGLHRLIAAFSAGRFPYKLLVIGNFNHDSKYAAAIRRSCTGRSDIILHDGLLSREMLLNVMRGAKLFVFPSEVEAMAMTLLEAISVQVPVVCSAIEENVAVVGEQYPYLFRLDVPDDLGHCISRALADEEIASVSALLYTSCLRRFSWSTIARRYEMCYDRLLS